MTRGKPTRRGENASRDGGTGEPTFVAAGLGLVWRPDFLFRLRVCRVWRHFPEFHPRGVACLPVAAGRAGIAARGTRLAHRTYRRHVGRLRRAAAGGACVTGLRAWYWRNGYGKCLLDAGRHQHLLVGRVSPLVVSVAVDHARARGWARRGAASGANERDWLGRGAASSRVSAAVQDLPVLSDAFFSSPGR